jgi:predicted nucleotidyltransferase
MTTRPLPSHDELAAAIREKLFAGKTEDPVAIYVFGSAAEDRLRDDSDVDIAFLARSPVDPVQVFEAAQALATQVGRDVDLVDLARASTVMRARVITHGSLVFVGDRSKIDAFEMYALSDYARLQEERAGVLRAFGAAYGV